MKYILSIIAGVVLAGAASAFDPIVTKLTTSMNVEGIGAVCTPTAIPWGTMTSGQTKESSTTITCANTGTLPLSINVDASDMTGAATLTFVSGSPIASQFGLRVKNAAFPSYKNMAPGFVTISSPTGLPAGDSLLNTFELRLGASIPFGAYSNTITLEACQFI